MFGFFYRSLSTPDCFQAVPGNYLHSFLVVDIFHNEIRRVVRLLGIIDFEETFSVCFYISHGFFLLNAGIVVLFLPTKIRVPFICAKH